MSSTEHNALESDLRVFGQFKRHDKRSTHESTADFLGAFEVIFRYDWAYTKAMIGGKAEGASFIEPGLENESENWGARGAMLEKYKVLLTAM